MKRLLGAFAAALGLMAATACTPTNNYEVYATVYPLVFLVNEIAEGTGIVAGMVPGISSHNQTADWSPKQIIAMSSASLIFYVGANLDAQIDNQITGIFEEQYAESRLVKIENEIQFIEGVVHVHEDPVTTETTTASEEPSAIGYDPHFWVSPKRMIQVAAVVLYRLVWAFPDFEETFVANHLDLLGRLTSLSENYQVGIDSGSKVMMTSTNLYSYLRVDYGIETISISPGYHEETEQFTAQQKMAIVDDAITHGIRFILYEKNASSPLSEAVLSAVNEAGLAYLVDKVEFNIMDKAPADGNDYLQIMYLNLQSIITATEIPIDVTD